jgi:predicted PurR-regulated permease PerM
MNIKKIFLITALLVAVLYLLHAYISAAVWAGVFAIILLPVVERFPVKNKSISAIICIVVLILCVLLPIIITATLAINEVTQYVNHHDVTQQINHFVQSKLSKLPMSGDLLEKLQHSNWKKEILNKFNVATVKSSLSAFQVVTSSITHLIFNVVFFILFLYYFLMNAEEIKVFTKKYCLDQFKNSNKILQEVINGTRGVSSGLFITSIVVAIIMTPTYFFVGLPLPLFFGLLSAFLAMIPFTLPVLYLLLACLCFFQSDIVSGIVILGIGFALNFVTDNILQPKIVQRNTKMHFFVSLLGVIGGLETLGVIGVFIGPVLLNLAYIFICELMKKN